MTTLHTVVQVTFMRMPVAWCGSLLLQHLLGSPCVVSCGSSLSQFHLVKMTKYVEQR